MRSRLIIFIAAVQMILFLGHWFLYRTLAYFWQTSGSPENWKLELALGLFSVSFVAASLLAFRFYNFVVRLFYTAAAAWLGLLNYCFLASCSCWIVYGAVKVAGFHANRGKIATVLFTLALVASIYGIVNASWMRVKRITVKLPNLPESWRGRVAALVGDAHLGHVRNYRFIRRIVAMLGQLRPDIVFLTGDLYDGTAADVHRLAQPLSQISAPFGAFFITGNHEEFRDHTKYVTAVARAGVRVLNNERVLVDGLQIVGVHHRDSVDPAHFRSILQRAALDRDRASVLLIHTPDRSLIAEQEGISLQLCGHTHRGQFFPYTWITSRIYGSLVYGLNRLGNLLVYTTSGAGTWGPPLRVGSNPEIVLIQFE
jgi:predicted MPP superfamily phosphohydrolase